MRTSKHKSSPRNFDADGTDAEVNRRLTNYIRENALVLEGNERNVFLIEESFFQKIQKFGVLFLILVLWFASLFVVDRTND